MGFWNKILGPAMAAGGVASHQPWLIGAGLMQTKKGLLDDPQKLAEARRNSVLQKSLIANSPWVDSAMSMASGIETSPGFDKGGDAMLQGAAAGAMFNNDNPNLFNKVNSAPVAPANNIFAGSFDDWVQRPGPSPWSLFGRSP